MVLLIFSEHSNDSSQVRREVERAVSKDKIILPVRIQDVLPSDAMEYALGNTQWLDVFPPPVERHMEELAHTVARLLERKVPGPPPPPPRPKPPEPHVVKPVSPVIDPVVKTVPPDPVRGSGGSRIWVWGGVVLVLVVLSVLVHMAFPPHEVVIREPEKRFAASPDSGTGKQDVVSMEEEAERFYKDKDYVAAFPLAKGACDRGVAAGCNYEAAMYLLGAGVGKDEVQAFGLYKKACDGGKAAGCSNLGAMYQNGKGVGQDDAQALTYYGKSCDEGYAIGCSAVGDIYEKGRGVEVDAGKAAGYYQKGCDQSSMVGCSRLAALYFDGRGVQQDQAQALKLYGKACDGKYQFACDFLKSHPQ